MALWEDGRGRRGRELNGILGSRGGARREGIKWHCGRMEEVKE